MSCGSPSKPESTSSPTPTIRAAADFRGDRDPAKNKIRGIIPKTTQKVVIEIDGRAGGPGAASDRRLLEMRRRNQMTLIGAGVPILLNTDGGLRHPDYLAQVDPAHWVDFGAIIGEGYFRGCQGMAEMGVPAMDIIWLEPATSPRLKSATSRLKGQIRRPRHPDADPLEDIRTKIRERLENWEIVDRKRSQKKILSGYYVE
jgi:hypothetical protein